MKATEAKLLQVVGTAPQFVIPIYQRTYSWTERECRQLWDDVVRAGCDERIAVHFLGSVVYIEDGLSNQTDRAPLLVIDGQQRLTTVMLLLCALRAALGDGEEPIDGFSKRKIENRYLRDPDEDGERSFKLLLTQTDKDTLTAIVAGKEPPENGSLTVQRNFDLFRALDRGAERTRRSVSRPFQADRGRRRAQPRARQPATHLRVHELDRPAAQPSGPHPQLRADGPGAERADAALHRPLAPHGAGLRAGGVLVAVRRLHAPLS